MRLRDQRLWLMACIVACAAGATPAAETGSYACDRAKKRTYPPGAPSASDVIMRSLRLRPRNAKDPHDTFQALKDFHVTRLSWAYITNKDFIAKVKASGRVFGGAASAPSFVPPTQGEDWYERVVVVNRKGEPIIAPWKRTWKRTLWGCVNNPDLERGYLAYLRTYIDAGADVMQRDEPGCNHLATRWGGCFCDHCIRGFREYLAEHTSADQRRRLGIDDLASFDYRKHLEKVGAPVGDPFGRWKGGELKELFLAFQMASSVAFHERTRKAIDAYAGRRVPFSCNNGAHRWTPVQLCYDWAFGELSFGRARPKQIHASMHEAAKHNRIQVVTMPKKGNRDDLDGWRVRTRRTIATAYACGGLCMAPWDVYMPHDAPRYFGKPAEYADLFAFVHACKDYLNGYEEVAVAGKPFQDASSEDTSTLRLHTGDGVGALLRARPGDRKAPVVVHVIDWGAEPGRSEIDLHPPRLFACGTLRITLLVPADYDRKAHVAAETSKDYSKLVKQVDVGYRMAGRWARVRLPVLHPWGLLVIEPGT